MSKLKAAAARPATPQHGTNAIVAVAHTPELLLQVFLSGHEVCSHTEFQAFRVAISSVCHQWRALALDMSELWADVCLPVNHDINLLGLHRHLLRSKQQPMKIHIRRFLPDAHDDTFEVERARTAAIMHLLLPHMHRWQELRADVRFLSSLQTLGEMCNGPAAQLEELSLFCAERNGEQVPVNLVGLPTQLQNVRTRTLRMGPHFAAPAPRRVAVAATTMLQHLLPSFRQTRELELVFSNVRSEGIEPVILMQNLAHYRRLCALTLRDVAFQPQLAASDVIQYPPMLLAGLVGGTRMEMLREITIRNVAPQFGCYVLRDIIAPQLEHLRIMGLSPQKVHPMLKTLATRQGPPLSSLTCISLERLPFDENLADALTYVPSCTHLHLDGCVTHIFFEDMSLCYLGNDTISDNYEDWVCPRLLILTLNCPNIDIFSLRRLVCRRYYATKTSPFCHSEKKPAALQELRVTTYDTITVEDYAWFQRHLAVFSWTTKPC